MCPSSPQPQSYNRLAASPVTALVSLASRESSEPSFDHLGNLDPLGSSIILNPASWQGPLSTALFFAAGLFFELFGPFAGSSLVFFQATLLDLMDKRIERCSATKTIKERFCFAFKGPKRPKGPNWVQLMNLAQASLMSFFSLTPKIIQVRICQDKQISDKRSAQLWGMLQFEFSFLICPDHICLLKCMQNAKFVASSCCYSSLDAFCITGRAAQLQLGHARMFLLRALDLDLDGLSRRNRPACDNGEGTELGSHGWPGVTQREKKNGKVMQNEKCHFYSL